MPVCTAFDIMWIYCQRVCIQEPAHTWLILLLFLISTFLGLLFLFDGLIFAIRVRRKRRLYYWFPLLVWLRRLTAFLVSFSFLFDILLFCLFFRWVLSLFCQTLLLLFFCLLPQLSQQCLRPRPFRGAPIFLLSKISASNMTEHKFYRQLLTYKHNTAATNSMLISTFLSKIIVNKLIFCIQVYTLINCPHLINSFMNGTAFSSIFISHIVNN